MGTTGNMNTEEFREQDREWRRRLQGHALVTEAEVDVDQATAALRTLAARALFLDAKQNRVAIMKRYAPTLLIGLTAVASTKYDEGTFWPRVGEVAEVEMTQPLQHLFSDTFRYGLDLFGLSRFDTPLRNLGEILMHAGVPVASVGDFLRVLQKRDSGAYDLTGSDLCAWATSMTRAAASAKGLDAPTWRFLSSGGDVAADLVDRFLSVLDAARESQAVDTLPLDALPPHIGAEVRRLIVTGEVKKSAGRGRSREGRLVPRLVYANGEIQLDLPAYEQRFQSEVSWQVTVAGQSMVRRVSAPWPGDARTPVRVSIPQPETNAVVTLRDRSLEWAVPIVDTTSPILVFDANTGIALASGSQLPKGRAWVAFPNETGSEVSDALEVQGSLTLIEHVDAPYGWDNWSFALVELSEVTRLRPRSGDDFRWRYVSPVTRPALEDVDTVPRIRAASGGFVLAERPRLTLPPTRQSADTDIASTVWTVTLTSAEGEVLNSFRSESSTVPVTVDPWPTAAGTIVGEFELHAQGPLGRGATFAIAVAEGVSTTASSDFRWFTSNEGLDNCTIDIVSSGQRDSLELDESTRTQATVIRDALGSPALTVTSDIDFMWVTTADSRGSTKPAIGPAQVERESLPETLIRLNTVPRIFGQLEVLAGGVVVQTARMDANATGIAVLNLATVSDTSEKHGVVSLRYVAGGRTTVVALVRPRQLIAELSVEDGILRLAKNGESVPLELGVYLDYAPWREPTVLTVPAGLNEVRLPDAIRNRGPAIIAARVEDPWTIEEWASEPPRRDGNSHHIDLPVLDVKTLDDSFLAWVGGELPLAMTSSALPFALDIYGTLSRARTARPRYELFSEIGELSRAQGDHFLDAARSATWTRATHTRLLAEGWAATAKAGDAPIDAKTWTLSPFLGVIESLGGWLEDSGELSEHLVAVLGEPAVAILERGTDSCAAVGAFKQEAEILSDWPKERIDAVWRAAAPIPGALLNADQRLLHARELFDSRLSQQTRDIARMSHGILRTVHPVLESEIGARVLTPIRARSGSDGWPSLPCLSISLSLLARLGSRGSANAAVAFDRYRSRFADLAATAPSFVEQDLVLAELWMTHWENE